MPREVQTDLPDHVRVPAPPAGRGATGHPSANLDPCRSRRRRTGPAARARHRAAWPARARHPARGLGRLHGRRRAGRPAAWPARARRRACRPGRRDHRAHRAGRARGYRDGHPAHPGCRGRGHYRDARNHPDQIPEVRQTRAGRRDRNPESRRDARRGQSLEGRPRREDRRAGPARLVHRADSCRPSSPVPRRNARGRTDPSGCPTPRIHRSPGIDLPGPRDLSCLFPPGASRRRGAERRVRAPRRGQSIHATVTSVPPSRGTWIEKGDISQGFNPPS